MKPISLVVAASIFAANPFVPAQAAPFMPSAEAVPNLVVQVKGEHHEGGHHGGGKHRGGGGKHRGHRGGGGKHHGGGKHGHHGGGKRHGGHHGGRHDHGRHDHHGRDHHDRHKHYHGWHRHQHHHWRWRNGVWVRPADYWWIAGGAIAAGAAIGYLSAADAGAWAYDPPAPTGYCWFYSDPSRKNGFWDQCPGPGADVSAPAAPVSAGQPNMQHAIDDLNEALAALRDATPNKGGHRERAMDIINQAIGQVQQGIDWANQHP